MRCVLLLSFLSFTPFLFAQMSEPPPGPLLDAGHCLAADNHDWLDVAHENPYAVELGFVSTDQSGFGKSEPASVPLYLIEFTSATHSQGFAFVFLSHGKNQHRDLQLQFRVPFRQADDGSQRVNLIDPPLGGIGTQDDIVAAIRKIGFHTWKIPVAQLRKQAGAVHCDMTEAIQ